ncbi:MAG: OmpA family protein [Alphaproteobacteria bacterium]|nr:OmpA family protein [Alphaproteobacteria bacterium]
MNKRILGASAIAVLLAGVSTGALAETKMYNNVPDGAEVARMLGAQPTYRAIEFSMPSPQAAQPPSQTVPASMTTPAPVPTAPPSRAVPASAPAQAASAGDSMGFRLNFRYNSAELAPESLPYVDAIGRAMRNEPRMQGAVVVIEGHTDASGTADYNLRLSERRAEAVKLYLIRQFGISSAQLQTVGKGKFEPIDAANPYSGENRRVEFSRAPNS